MSWWKPQLTAATWVRMGSDESLPMMLVDREAQRDPGAGDRGGAGAAIGLDDVAIER